MESYEHREIVIIGGGISGLATALAFHRKGIRCTDWKGPRLRAAEAAIIMKPIGWRAVDHLGVADELRQTAMLIERDDQIRCLKRQDLVRLLADNLPKGTILFGCKVVSLKIDEKSSSILHLDGGRVLTAKVHSIVSDALEPNPMMVKDTCVTRGFAYYPKGHSLLPDFSLYNSAQGQLGYLPITNNSVYWFVIRPLKPTAKGTRSVSPERSRPTSGPLLSPTLKGQAHQRRKAPNRVSKPYCRRKPNPQAIGDQPISHPRRPTLLPPRDAKTTLHRT